MKLLSDEDPARLCDRGRRIAEGIDQIDSPVIADLVRGKLARHIESCSSCTPLGKEATR